MAKWLVKSEPSSWSFAQQIEAGKAGTSWNGVRNHTAKQYLMAMAMGDEAFFYHSNDGKEIVGIVAVSRTYYPDPTDAKGKFGMVDFSVVRPLDKPVTLDAIKKEAALQDMVLVKNSRLSVQPVTEAEWDTVLRMAAA
ncbi:EVE domain-containing protein [Lichenifustis flavocetrariae]|uniref:EVE domain-containing protein n=1 Tax=Lichenifustis flavocetrariae TaxID=2949735 RepID=A0AA41Z1A3_9HYPH|nr:EVE domain-containing protein [Lichenifustis flavocetrariae]MCW6507422.1 EVE domain-containing protein [Lichenifustis flavocetrariae]